MAATPRAETDQTRLERLTALRQAQESALSGEVPLREFAALSREYRATLAEIDALRPKEVAGDGIDEIAARRDARRSRATKSAARAKRSG